MIQKNYLFVVALLSIATVWAQPVRLKLPRQINVPAYNHYAPSVSTDGLTMIFATDYYVTQGNKVDLKIAVSKGGDNWSSGEDVTVINKFSELNHSGGHCLSPDGNSIYFSSRKMGGVGGFDLWLTEKKGGKWAVPQNLGKPLNSVGGETFPSVTPDGKYLYFTRCQTVTAYSCESCRLYVAEHKGQGIWKEPIALPAPLSNYEVMYPRILKDGKTLLFSSNAKGGKGGYDLYLSRKTETGWSTPQNLEFLNTSGDELYADVPAQSESMIYAAITDEHMTLYKAKLPEAYQPSKVVVIAGKAMNATEHPISGFVQVADNETGTPISMTRIDTDGKFSAVLPAGKEYDMVVSGPATLNYWSATFAAKTLAHSRKEEVEAVLLPLQKGLVLHGNKPVFDSVSYQALPGTLLEVKRISKLLQSHPEIALEIVLFPAGLTESAPENPESVYEKMKDALTAELSKSSAPATRITFSNGSGTEEEANSYCGWALKIK